MTRKDGFITSTIMEWNYWAEEHEIVGRTLFETIIPDIETSGRDVKPLVHDLLCNPTKTPQGEGETCVETVGEFGWPGQIKPFNEQGEVVEILSVGNDTTQRRQAEEALQRSEAKFRTFENSQVGIFRTASRMITSMPTNALPTCWALIHQRRSLARNSIDYL